MALDQIPSGKRQSHSHNLKITVARAIESRPEKAGEHQHDGPAPSTDPTELPNISQSIQFPIALYPPNSPTEQLVQSLKWQYPNEYGY